MMGWVGCAAIVVGLSGLGCATAAFEAGCSPEAGSRTQAPLMWRADARGHGGALYLFGSIHFEIENAPPLAPEIEAAFALSDELVVEVDVSRSDLGAGLEELGLLESPTQLADLLAPSTLELLERYLTERGLALSYVQGMKPWYVANLLVWMELRDGGYEAQHGVDRQFIERASGKPIVELETADEQRGLLDRMPLRIQEAMLRDALNRSVAFDRATDQLFAAWRYGDEQLLREIVFRPIGADSDFESFYESIFFQRNQTMAERLAELSRDGKTRFAVIGAGHMLGPRGIPALLCDRDFEVRRVTGGGRASVVH